MITTSARARFPPSPTRLCRNSFTESRPPPRKPFPLPANEPFNFLNLDLYAQDTWKVTPKLTWTFGIRDTLNSNPSQSAPCRLRACPAPLTAISHDVNQPLNAAIQTDLGNLFASTPLAILQPRTAIAWQFAPNTVLRAGLRTLQRYPAGQRRRPGGRQSALRQDLPGRPAGHRRRNGHCAGSAGQRRRRHRGRESGLHFRIRAGQLSCASPLANPATCLPPVAITAVPDGKLHAPYFMEWSFGIEHQFGSTAAFTRSMSARAP